MRCFDSGNPDRFNASLSPPQLIAGEVIHASAGVKTATIYAGQTKELILAAIDGQRGALVIDNWAINSQNDLGEEIVLGFGEWIVDGELLGVGVHKTLRRMRMLITKENEPTIKRFFHLFNADPSSRSAYDFIPKWPQD